ncbi:MAG: YbaB/EbfC family nucleoid-associated protein [Acidimicrobiia bacterium]
MSEPSLGDLLAQAQQMQQQLMAAQAQAAAAVVEGSAGGGAVKISVNGHLEFRSVHIDPEVIDPEDPSMLEDLVLAALGDAMAQIGEMQQGAIGGLDLGALGDLGGLGGMLGQG